MLSVMTWIGRQGRCPTSADVSLHPNSLLGLGWIARVDGPTQKSILDYLRSINQGRSIFCKFWIWVGIFWSIFEFFIWVHSTSQTMVDSPLTIEFLLENHRPTANHLSLIHWVGILIWAGFIWSNRSTAIFQRSTKRVRFLFLRRFEPNFF